VYKPSQLMSFEHPRSNKN